jgi:hypothetical protein
MPNILTTQTLNSEEADENEASNYARSKRRIAVLEDELEQLKGQGSKRKS